MDVQGRRRVAGGAGCASSGIVLALALAVCAPGLSAQSLEAGAADPSGGTGAIVETVQIAQTQPARAAHVRWLDKISGETADLRLAPGDAETRDRLTVVMSECRVPSDNPASDAFAHLTVTDSRVAAPVFSGWMIASSPALSALDHARYDVWLLGCETEAGSGE